MRVVHSPGSCGFGIGVNELRSVVALLVVKRVELETQDVTAVRHGPLLMRRLRYVRDGSPVLGLCSPSPVGRNGRAAFQNSSTSTSCWRSSVLTDSK